MLVCACTKSVSAPYANMWWHALYVEAILALWVETLHAQVPDSQLSPLNAIHSFQDPSVVLSSQETLLLYLAPPRGWYPGNSKCLKSKLVDIREGGKIIVRTIEFYRADLESGSFVPALLTVTMRVVRRSGDTVIIEALETSNGETLPPIDDTKENKGPKKDTNPPPRKPRSLSENSKLYLPGVNRLPVLFASNSCVVIGGSTDNKYQACTLWTTESSVKLPARCCKFTFVSQCYRQGYEAYESENMNCKIYDDIYKDKWRNLRSGVRYYSSGS
uniref:Putative secreted protein n=1 Tax=Amblyomma triste TaxID=251400 RepID=A0A023G5Y8_AMBTT